jgi:hypothetical protein
MTFTRCIVWPATSALLLVAAPALALITSSTPFTIGWTAPGDDGVTGRAMCYDLRYSGLPLTAANFDQATQVVGLPAPAAAGTAESFVVSGLPDSVPIYMALRSADDTGNWSTISNVVTRPVQTTEVDPSALEVSFSLPRPNPARQSVRWVYSLPQASRVQVDVFDITGRHVHAVADGTREAGRGDLSWDLHDDRGGPVEAGLYFVKARLGSKAWTTRLVVVR